MMLVAAAENNFALDLLCWMQDIKKNAFLISEAISKWNCHQEIFYIY